MSHPVNRDGEVRTLFSRIRWFTTGWSRMRSCSAMPRALPQKSIRRSGRRNLALRG